MKFAARVIAATAVVVAVLGVSTSAFAVDYCTNPDGSVVECVTTTPTTDPPITSVSTSAPVTASTTTAAPSTTTTKPKPTTTTTAAPSTTQSTLATTASTVATTTQPAVITASTVVESSISYVPIESTVAEASTQTTPPTVVSNLISIRTTASGSDTGLSTLSLVLILACVLWILAVLAYFIIDRPVARR